MQLNQRLSRLTAAQSELEQQLHDERGHWAVEKQGMQEEHKAVDNSWEGGG